MKTLYTASVNVVGGRNGEVKSSDGILNFPVRMPKELGGSGGATNPEQLFAAGYAACFDGALNLVARNQKISIGQTSITAHVSIGPNDKGGFQLAAKLQVKIPGVERNVGEQLLKAAHEVCPYSNATRGNIDVELELLPA